MSGPLRVTLLVAALALAACDDPVPGGVEVVQDPASTTTVTTMPVDGAPAGPGPGPGIPGGPGTPEPEPEPEDEVGSPVVLREDGLGDTLRFGAATDTIIVALTLRWGPPDRDSGWLESTPEPTRPFDVECPGTRVRGVSWGQFTVVFTDGQSPHGPPAPKGHFFTWIYAVTNVADPRPDPGGNRPPLETAAGISVGATVAELRAAYGDGLNLYDDSTEEGVVTSGPGFAAAGLYGTLTGLEPEAQILRMVGGGGGCS